MALTVNVRIDTYLYIYVYIKSYVDLIIYVHIERARF